MKKSLIIPIIFICILLSFMDMKVYGQEERQSVPLNDNDTLQKNKFHHGVSFELLGPYFFSSLGYNLEKQIKKKISVQFDFRIAGYIGYWSNGWAIGPSISQSVLLGDKLLKLKLGLTEGIVFNPPSINGKFDNLQSWDRPPKTVYFFSGNIGCEIRAVKGFLYITPEVNIVQGNLITLTGEAPNEQQVRISGFIPSFGIDLKLRL